MRKSLFYLLSVIILSWTICPSAVFAENKIHILYDSKSDNPDLKTGWGFSALVEKNDLRILVDTGWDEAILQHNMEKLGWTPQDITDIVISHSHHDHYGGLRWLLGQNSSIKVYVPADFSIAEFAGWQINTVKGFTRIAENIYVLQTNPSNDRFGIEEELTLALSTSQGPVLVSGCYHTGWPELIKKVKEVDVKKTYLMVGGGRFIDKSETELEELAQTLKALNLQNVGLSHCAAGSLPEQVFNKYYKDHSVNSGLGKTILLPD
jgi:7,8-dihydropterin-6-yl-methyl-4-(beta-D-ribofuranosyl)aminobenzene 5'-phosphate synthase